MTHVEPGPHRKRDGRADVVDGADPGDRHLGEVVGDDGLVGEQRVGQLGAHQPGTDGVDPDAARPSSSAALRTSVSSPAFDTQYGAM